MIKTMIRYGVSIILSLILSISSSFTVFAQDEVIPLRLGENIRWFVVDNNV